MRLFGQSRPSQTEEASTRVVNHCSGKPGLPVKVFLPLVPVKITLPVKQFEGKMRKNGSFSPILFQIVLKPDISIEN